MTEALQLLLTRMDTFLQQGIFLQAQLSVQQHLRVLALMMVTWLNMIHQDILFGQVEMKVSYHLMMLLLTSKTTLI